MDSTITELGTIAALDAARRGGRFVYPVTFNDETQCWLPRDFGGDDGFPVSRSRRQIETWSELYPNDAFAVVPRGMEDSWCADLNETFEDATWHQATLDEVEYRKVKAQQNAKRKLAAENYHGTRVLAWEEFMDQPQAQWLVDGLIGEGTVNFLVARPNLGKTFTFLDMALCMITAKPWHGKTTAQGKVLLVIGEGLPTLHLRVMAWCEHHGVSLDDVREWLSIVDGANLNNDTSIQTLADHIEDFAPSLVVFDTWSATSGVVDENEAALAQATLNAARAVAPNAALMFTTHPNKGSELSDHPVLRGSGALAGAADVVMTMYVDNYQAASGLDRKYLALSTEAEHGGKNRNHEQETMRGFYLEAVQESAVLKRDESGTLSKADLFAFEWLEVGEPVTAKEVTERSGTSESTVKRYLANAKAVVTVKGAGTQPNTYTLNAGKAPRSVGVGQAALKVVA